MRETELLALARRQGGVVTRGQALAHGHTRHTIGRRVDRRGWGVVAKGVYRLIPAMDELDVLRGAVATLPDAVVSHTSAGRLLRLGNLPLSAPTVTVVASTTHRFEGAVVCRAVAGVPVGQRVEVEGLPLTGVARTVVDLAAVLVPSFWEELAQSLVVAGRTSLSEISSVASVVCGRGRPGSTMVRHLLGDPMAGSSALERRIAVVLEPFSPSLQLPAPWDDNRRLDFAFPAAKLAVEADGRRWHSTARSFAADRARDHAALRHGWMVVRLTERDQPDEVRGIIAGLIAERTQGSRSV